MAKNNKSKSAAPEIEAPEKKAKGPVLVKKTASELHDLIGDTPIGVSRKELKAALVAKAVADLGGDDL